jgi:hypothetical protein
LTSFSVGAHREERGERALPSDKAIGLGVVSHRAMNTVKIGKQKLRAISEAAKILRAGAHR